MAGTPFGQPFRREPDPLDDLVIRWTIGDVSPAGFEALMLSVWGAWRLFGPAAYTIGVNTVPVKEARRRTGRLPAAVSWFDASRRMPAGFDLEAAIRRVLERKDALLGRPARLSSELDEQGLQAAALSLREPARLVSVVEVTVCSPFRPHLPHLGRSGAHFVGLNARHIPWQYYGRPADDWMAGHWRRHKPALYEKIRPAEDPV